MENTNTPPGAAPQQPTDGLPPIINLADFLASELPLPKPLVKGVFDVGSKLVLGSGSKSYKTWIVADLATAVASGTPWLGLETQQGRVLFLNFEIPAAFFQRRIKAVISAKGLPATIATNIDVWNLRGHGGNYKRLIPQIAARIKDKGFDLLLADPAYKLYGNIKENEAAAMGEFFNAGEELVVVCNVGLLLSAHFSKGNQSLKDAIDRVSGSGVWARDPDTFIAITPHKVPGAFTVDITVRNYPEIKAFVVRWKYPLMHVDANLDPLQLREPPAKSGKREKGEKYTGGDLMELLGKDGPFDTVETFYNAAHAAAFLSKAEFKGLLKLIKTCSLVHCVKGRWSYGNEPH